MPFFFRLIKENAYYLQEVNFMAMDVSKGDVLEGFQKLLGSVMIPALQKQEVCYNLLLNSHIHGDVSEVPVAQVNGVGIGKHW